MRCLILLVAWPLLAAGSDESLVFRGAGTLSDGRVFTSRLAVTIGERDEGLPLSYRLEFTDGSSEQLAIKLLPPAEDGEQDRGVVEMAGEIVGSWSGGPTSDAETMTIDFRDADTEVVVVLKFGENNDEDSGDHILIPFVIQASVSRTTGETTISWQDTLRLDFTSVL